MAFYVGQKVVCVDASGTPHGTIAPGEQLARWDGRLREGSVYTVRWVGLYRGGFVEEKLCVRLLGIKRNYFDGDTPYCATRFRPVVEKKTDISIFTALLNPANHKHLEGV